MIGGPSRRTNRTVECSFHGRLAATGQGEPVTRTTRLFSKEGVPLAIWDTRGLEMSDFDDTLNELTQLVEKRAKEPEPQDHIHVAWLCLHEDGRRVEPAETKLCRALAQHMLVLGVITKARSDDGFRHEVQRLLPETKNVVRFRAIAEKFDDSGHSLPPMGLDDLPREEDTIRHLADESELLAVAIDGPLRRRFDVIGRYRSAERLLSRGILPRHIGKPGQSNSPHGRKLNAEANRVAIFVKRCCLVSKAMHENSGPSPREGLPRPSLVEESLDRGGEIVDLAEGDFPQRTPLVDEDGRRGAVERVPIERRRRVLA